MLNRLAEGLPSANLLEHAPMAIVVAGDTLAGNPNQEQVHNWVMDCAAASQNMLLAAHALGLGAVWTGVYPYQARIDTVIVVVNIPDNIILLNVIPIGYPKSDHEPKDK